MFSIDPAVVNFKFGVEGNSARRVPVKLKINFERVVRVFENVRTADLGVICAPVVVVVLKQGQGAFEGHSGYERDTDPVMDQTIGNLNRFAFLSCLLLVDFELPTPG